MYRRVVTISREFGSGGRTVGKIVAEKLGIAFYDKEIIDLAAKESGFTPEFVEEQGEDALKTNSFLFQLAMSKSFPTRSFSQEDMSPMDQLFVVQSRIIREIAEREPCVIVGRCADYVLKARSDCLNAFIFADPLFRAERIVKVYGEKEDSPEKRVQSKDQKRKVYYKHYTGRSWGAAHSYHVSLDSGVVGIERCADIIVDIASRESYAVK